MSDIATGIILGFVACRLFDLVAAYFFDTDADGAGCTCDAVLDHECVCDDDVDELAGPETARLVHSTSTPAASAPVADLDAAPAAVLAEQRARTRLAMAEPYLPVVAIVVTAVALVLLWAS